MRIMRFGALICLLASVPAATLSAQSAPAYDSRTFVVSGGLIAARGYGIGDQTADLRRSGTDTMPCWSTV